MTVRVPHHQSHNDPLDMVLVLSQGDHPGVTAFGLELTLGVVRDDLHNGREGHRTENSLVGRRHVPLNQSTSRFESLVLD